MSLGNVFYLAAVVTEAAVVGLLVRRRVGRKLPVFVVYCVWALLNDGATLGYEFLFHRWYGIRLYTVSNLLDFSLQFCVLVELTWSVLEPVRKRLARRALLVTALGILAAGAAIWPFARLGGVAAPGPEWHILFQLQQTASIVRVAFFVLLAGCSRLLSLGWRDRELQVATGFGFYSLVSLTVAVLNTHQSNVAQFVHLYWAVAISFMCTLLYWVVSFAQQDAQRRAFTPQMERALLAMAEAAHLTRAALALPYRNR